MRSLEKVYPLSNAPAIGPLDSATMVFPSAFRFRIPGFKLHHTQGDR